MEAHKKSQKVEAPSLVSFEVIILSIKEICDSKLTRKAKIRDRK
jgi:hypothetical protein